MKAGNNGMHLNYIGKQFVVKDQLGFSQDKNHIFRQYIQKINRLDRILFGPLL